MPDVSVSTRATLTYDAVASLASTTIEPLELLHEACRRVGRVVPFDLAGWVTLDPDSLLPTGVPLFPAPEGLTNALWRNELQTADVQKLADLAAAPVPVAALSELDAATAERSERRALLTAHGLGDEVRMAFRAGGAAWGAGCLVRSCDAGPFERGELRFLARLSAIVGRGLQLALARRAAVKPSEPRPAVVMLGLNLQIMSATASARPLLALLPGDPGPTLFGVALRARENGHAHARVRLSDARWLALSAEFLAGAPGRPHSIVLTLETSPGAEIAPLLLRVHGLTPREREIAELLLTGLPTDALAARLFISQNTLRRHMKAIFAKLGTRSRSELMALISGGDVRASAALLPSGGRVEPDDLGRTARRLLTLAAA